MANVTTADLMALLPGMTPEQQASIAAQLKRPVPLAAVIDVVKAARVPLNSRWFGVELPIRTNTQAAGTGGHWAAKAKQASSQIKYVVSRLSRLGDMLPVLPVRVKLTRLGRRCDDDNLRAALKHVRDAIAKVFGRDDGDDCFIWEYAQLPPSRTGVIIEIETRI